MSSSKKSLLLPVLGIRWKSTGCAGIKKPGLIYVVQNCLPAFHWKKTLPKNSPEKKTPKKTSVLQKWVHFRSLSSISFITVFITAPLLTWTVNERRRSWHTDQRLRLKILLALTQLRILSLLLHYEIWRYHKMNTYNGGHMPLPRVHLPNWR